MSRSVTQATPPTVRPGASRDRPTLTAMAMHRVPGPPTLPRAAWINKPLTALVRAAPEGMPIARPDRMCGGQLIADQRPANQRLQAMAKRAPLKGA
jgi:hypothetical protein